MASNLREIIVETREKDLVEQCHLMPCRIEHRGDTVKAKEYFWPTIKVLGSNSDTNQGRDSSEQADYDRQRLTQGTNSNPVMTASFRGRPLQGRKIKLNDGYKGVVVPADGSQARKVFREFTYWNWDELPSDEDVVVKSLQWISIARAIHDDV